MMYWDLNGLTMENRIMKKKLLFIHHLETLPEDSLAHEVYVIQKQYDLPGLVKECKDFLINFNIKPYIRELDLEGGRLRFKLRTAMVPTVKMCFPVQSRTLYVIQAPTSRSTLLDAFTIKVFI